LGQLGSRVGIFSGRIQGKGIDVLVLSRKVGEKILIGEKISVTIVRVSGGGVRLGIEAPPELAVIREELQNSMQEAETGTHPKELKTKTS